MSSRKLHSVQTMDNPSKQPAIWTGVSVTAVAALFSMLNLALPNLMSDQAEQNTLVIAAFILPLITAFIARNFVWSPASVLEVVKEAVTEAEKVQARKPPIKLPPSIDDLPI